MYKYSIYKKHLKDTLLDQVLRPSKNFWATRNPLEPYPQMHIADLSSNNKTITMTDKYHVEL